MMCGLRTGAGLTLLVGLIASLGSFAYGEPPDARLGELKTLNGHFPFAVPDSKAAWEQRAESLRHQIRIATGLWPEPERTPLNAVIHGRSERDGFTIEKVYFESLPGHFVTGLLFRPRDGKSETVKRPGILCPHGHGGRMERFSDEKVKHEIAAGHERYVESGQTQTLARCAQLARMGCVSFIFDMLGYEDSVQISFEVAHRHQDARPEESRPADGSLPDSWVMFSTDAELRLQSIMGLQVWNASRALDFLASLPDVDPQRLGVTGNSGGGTQTILLGAIDPRVKVSFPNGMVSTSMQGGCYCENCNLLRIGTGNAELAGLMAPRPQAMTAVNDWTRDMMTDGYPQLQQLYRMVGNEADVQCSHFPDFPHSYNYVTRGLMYAWMNKHLPIGVKEPIVEGDYSHITDEEASVWTVEHPHPTSVGPNHERDVCKWFDEQAEKAIDKLWPKSIDDVNSFHSSLRQAWKTILSVDDSIVPVVTFEASVDSANTAGLANTKIVHGYLKNAEKQSAVPLAVVTREGKKPTGPTVIWCLDGGKANALKADGEQSRLLQKLLDKGCTVLLPDLFGQGEYSPQGDLVRQRLIDDERHYAAFTFGYNKTLDAERVSDLIDVATFAHDRGPTSVAVIGSGNVASVTLAVAALSDFAINRSAVMLDGFRFANVDSYASANFVPGSVKYGDVDALIALSAPRPLLLRDEGSLDARAHNVYELANASDQLVIKNASLNLASDELAEFLSKP